MSERAGRRIKVTFTTPNVGPTQSGRATHATYRAMTGSEATVRRQADAERQPATAAGTLAIICRHREVEPLMPLDAGIAWVRCIACDTIFQPRAEALAMATEAHQQGAQQERERRDAAGIDVERLARAMARCAEVGPPAYHTPEQAEEHWGSYRMEAEQYAAEYARLAGAGE